MDTKIIFLDFDGVLDDDEFLSKNGYSGWYKRIHDKVKGKDFSPRCISQLNRIVKQTGAGVVIISSWRINHTTKELHDLLKDNGFKGRVIGKTDTIGIRQEEVSQYLFKLEDPLPKSEYVIIDDEDFYNDEDFSDRFIQVEYPYCLNEEKADKAIKLLLGR